MPNIEAGTVVATFISGWISIFGCPKYVQTDRGSQFTSNQRQKCMEYWEIQNRTTHAYSPFQNDAAERAH